MGTLIPSMQIIGIARGNIEKTLGHSKHNKRRQIDYLLFQSKGATLPDQDLNMLSVYCHIPQTHP